MLCFRKAIRLRAEASGTRRSRPRPHFRPDHDDAIGGRLPAADPGLGAADVGLVDLDREPLPPGTDHGATELVEPDPGRLVARESEHAAGPGRWPRSSGW